MRKTFESEIQQVKDDVLVLGSMVEEAILNTVEALKKRDIKASEEILNTYGYLRMVNTQFSS